jgi:hypothetical protein
LVAFEHLLVGGVHLLDEACRYGRPLRGAASSESGVVLSV